MKKLNFLRIKFKRWSIGLSIGWLIGMTLGFLVLHPVDGLWWIMQLSGLGVCLIIMFASAKKNKRQ